MALRSLTIVLALALVAGAGWYAYRADADRQDGTDCPTTLHVVTASSFATVMSAAGRTLRSGADCVLVDTIAADGRPAVGQVSQASADLWLPDDAAWAGIAPPGLLLPIGKKTAESEANGAGTTVATSPILMVTDPATADRLKAAGTSWKAFADALDARTSGIRMVVRDPGLSGDGLVAAGAVGEAVWLDKGMDASSLALNKTIGQTRTVTHDLAALPVEPGEVGLVPEYALLPTIRLGAANRVYLAATDHTAQLRYTWLPTAGAVRDAKKAGALKRLMAALGSQEARQAMATAGLRGPDKVRPRFDGAEALPEPTAEPFAVLGQHHVQHVFATWDPEDRRSNLLIIADIAGGTAGSASTGGSRAPSPAAGASASAEAGQQPIDVLKAGCRVVAELMPVGSRLGLWEIAPAQGGYRKLLPADRLDENTKAAFTRSVNGLTVHKAGPGLLDAIVAGYQSVRDDWREDVFNQVFILTDDQNKDSADSVAVQQMVDKIKALQDPERPVSISIVVLRKKDAADRLKAAMQPLGAYVDNAGSGDDVQAAFIHVVAGGLHE